MQHPLGLDMIKYAKSVDDNGDGPQIHFIRKASKKDTQVVTSDVLIMEDEFQGLYISNKKNTNVVIEPPFNPLVLASLVTRNNILQQCITTMEVNIDGTGHTFDLLEPEEDKETGDVGGGDTEVKEPEPLKDSAPASEGTAVAKVLKFAKNPTDIPQDAFANTPQPNPSTTVPVPSNPATAVGAGPKETEESSPEVDKEKEMLEHFFDEPFPGMSFVTLRRKLRVDLEATGNAYMEVIRNLKGEVVFLRHLESVMMRLVKLDAPVNVDVAVMRGGTEITATLPMRERRFCYKVGANLVFYRDFGSSRQVNKKTAAWIEPDDKNVDQSLLGSEVIHFTVNKDFRTHYGLPRWINNLPSVLGSRKAEEYNLEFFDSGGIPPAIMFIQGGALVGGVKEQLQHFLSGKASQKHRAAIVEVTSTSGSLDSAGSVQVKTERFGSSVTDFMFQKYDDQTKEHIRTSFRIPGVLIGISNDYNLATSISALKSAEAQVFQPERFEFDEVINKKILKALGAKRYKFTSNPTVFTNDEIQIQSMQYAAPVLGGEEVVKTLNAITGLSMEYSEDKDPTKQQQLGMGGDMSDGMGGGDPSGYGDSPDTGYSPQGQPNNFNSDAQWGNNPPAFGGNEMGSPPPTGANATY